MVQKTEVEIFQTSFAPRTLNKKIVSSFIGGEKIMREVIIYPGEDGYWIAECPSLHGCISQGKTREEAIANIKEAIQGYISVLEEDHLPVPEERFETLVVAV